MMDEGMHVFTDQIVDGGITEETKAGLIGEGTTALEVDAVDRLRRGIEQEAGLLLTLPQLLLRELASRDILGNTGVAADRAVLILDWKGAGPDPSDRAVRSDQPVFRLKIARVFSELA